ncbi:phosphopantetheine-binding protein [Azorhizobium doebereinerae]|uniref:phosphopantetheine-binding protein n=1 Tax=Azorhizobium doebereinerae TaxID=281091 RepID=UPI003CC9171F
MEAALLACPGVRQAACDAIGSGADRRLAAWLVADAGLDTALVRRTLARRLPDHMVPGAFALVDHMPQTPTGKLDRKALPPIVDGGDRQAFAPPETPLQEMLAAVWADILGRSRIGIFDNFFDLGGHSLLATRVVSLLRGRLGLDVALMMVFERPTIADLAAALEDAAPGRPLPAPDRPMAAGSADRFDDVSDDQLDLVLARLLGGQAQAEDDFTRTTPAQGNRVEEIMAK